MRFIAFAIGLILLLPGACAFGFLIMSIPALPSLGSAEWRDAAIWGMIGIATVGWGFCFLISFGGVMLMRGALKPGKPPPPPGD
jgi:hypothetical protein